MRIIHKNTWYENFEHVEKLLWINIKTLISTKDKRTTTPYSALASQGDQCSWKYSIADQNKFGKKLFHSFLVLSYSRRLIMCLRCLTNVLSLSLLKWCIHLFMCLILAQCKLFGLDLRFVLGREFFDEEASLTNEDLAKKRWNNSPRVPPDSMCQKQLESTWLHTPALPPYHCTNIALSPFRVVTIILYLCKPTSA